VRVSPRASRDSIDGCIASTDGRQWLAVRQCAPPVDGAANAALIKLLAQRLGVAHRDVRLVSGQAARLKRLHISGDPDRLSAALSSIIGEQP